MGRQARYLTIAEKTSAVNARRRKTSLDDQ
jgi:hypothetical protein